MKKLVVLCIALSLIACKKEEKKEEKSGIGSAIENMSNLGKIANKMDDVQKNMDELKTKTPISNDELKAAIPETLGGLKRTEITVGNMTAMSMSSADAKYSGENKNIEINMIDGAGEAGSSVISIMLMTLNADMEKTTENGFEKTAQINGNKAFVSQNTNGDAVSSEIKYIAKGRYMITASADGFTVDELAEAVKGIDISKLP